MSKRTIYLTLSILLVFLLAGMFFLSNRASQNGNAEKLSPSITLPVSSPTIESSPTPTVVENFMVTYTASEFSPKSLTVPKGSMVVFKNNSGEEMWIASAIHPNHTIYPGTDITKCGTSQEGMFDACKGVAAGESWPFTFNEQGSWRYHDHLHPTANGTIVVE